jgi:hypothetical protein
VGLFFLSVSSRFFELRDKVMTSEIDEFPFQDLCALSDEDIFDLYKNQVKASTSLHQMNFLSKLKKQIKTSQSGKFFLHFNFHRGRMYKLDRKQEELHKWIFERVEELSPLICLKNKSQKENIKFFFSDMITDRKIDIDNLESFLNSRFYIIGSSPNTISKGDFSVALGEHGVPSELIREIFIRIQNLKTENSKRNIQKWLFHLFFGHEGDGFSTHNIKKVTESLSLE